jgi:AcrR family transcriptional regulator
MVMLVGRVASGRAQDDRLSREDWIDGALDELTRGGIRALSVEGLARAMGVTKGSFYWHFGSRDKLLFAVLERWEQVDTVERFARLDAIADPVERIHRMFEGTMEDEATLALDFRVHVAADDPLVGPFARRANRTWVAWLTGLYEELGVVSEDAPRWALLCYANYVGFLRLISADPKLIARGPERQRWRRFLYGALVP